MDGYDDGDFSSATFYYPQGITIDSKGDLIVSDYASIRRLSLSSRKVINIAGNSECGFRSHF